MRKIYLLFVLLSLNIAMVAQSIELSRASDDVVIEHNDTVFVDGLSDASLIQAHIKVKNASANAISAIATREDVLLPGDMEVAFCFGMCYPPNTTVSNPVQIAANSYIDGTLDVDLQPKNTEGIALVKVTVANQADDQDFITVFVKFNITPVGIADEEAIFEIFPNPVSDVLYVNYSDFQSNVSIELYDALGKLVVNQQLNNQQISVDLSGLQNGLYFIKLMNGNQVLNTRKVIKR